MGRARTLIVLTLILLQGGIFVASSSASAREYRVGDWTVTGIEQKFDSVIDLRGNLTVKAGGSLTFRNVTLLFNSTVDMRYGIKVEAGGELFLLEGSVIGAVDPLIRNRFEVLPGARATIISSTVGEIGTTTADGFRILSDDVVVQSSTVRNSSVGLNVVGAEPRLTSVTLTANTVGARLENTTAVLDRATVTRSVIGVDIADAEVSLPGCRIEQNNLGIRSVRSMTKATSATVRSNLDGISIDRGTFSLEGSTVTLSSLAAIKAKNASVFVNYSSVNQNLEGARAEHSALNSSYSSFWGNTRDLALKGNSTIANLSDSSFDTKLVIYTDGARLDRYWSLRLRVVNEKGLPVYNASVEVNHTKLGFLWRNRTSAQGYSPFIPLFVMSANATSTTWAGAYNVSAEQSGSHAEAAVNVTTTLTRVLVLRSPPPPLVVTVTEIKAFSARVNWTPYAGSDFLRYDVHVSNSSWDPGPPKKNSTTANVVSAVVGKLKPDASYYAWVRLTVAGGRYSFSSPVPFRTTPEFPYPYNHTSELKVCSLLVLKNGTWFVNGNVTVCTGGTLRLENATIVLNSTVPGKHGVTVETGGSLSAVSGRFSSRSRLFFSSRPGSLLDLEDSQLDKLVGGARIDTETASFLKVRVEDSDDGLVILRGTPAVRSLSVTNVSRGIVASGRDLVVEDLETLDTSVGLEVDGGAIVLRDAVFTNCTAGLRAAGSEVIAERVTAADCAEGVSIEDSPRADVTSLTTRGGGTGLRAVNATVSLAVLDHAGTSTAVDLKDAKGTISSMLAKDGERGLVLRGSEVSVATLTADKVSTAVSATDSELVVFDPRISSSSTGFLALRSNLTADSGYVSQAGGPCLDLRNSNTTVSFLQVSGGSHSILQSGGSVELLGSILTGARVGVESNAVFNATNVHVTGAALYAMSLSGATASLRGTFLSSGGLAGLKASSSKVWMQNSSIAPALRAVTLQKSTLDLLGTSVPAGSVEVDPLSRVTYAWHGAVRVIDHDGAPVEGANVSVADGPNGTYSVKKVTGPSGSLLWLRLAVRETNGTRENSFNPFVFRAWLGASAQERTLNVSGNLTVILALVTPPRPVTLLPVKQENVFEDRVVLEWNATGPGEIAWMETQMRASGAPEWEVKENLTEPVPSKIVIFSLAPATGYEARLAVYNRLGVSVISESRTFTTKPFDLPPELSQATVPATACADAPFEVSVIYRDPDGDPPKYVVFVANGTHALSPGELVGAGTRYSKNVVMGAGKYSAYFEADDNRSSPRSKNVTQRMNLVVSVCGPGTGVAAGTVAVVAVAAVALVALGAVAILRRSGWRTSAAGAVGRPRREPKPEPREPSSGTEAASSAAAAGSADAAASEPEAGLAPGEADAPSAEAEGGDPPGHPLHPAVAAGTETGRKLARKYRALVAAPAKGAAGEKGGGGDGGASPGTGS